jgi:hypothetical protein
MDFPPFEDEIYQFRQMRRDLLSGYPKTKIKPYFLQLGGRTLEGRQLKVRLGDDKLTEL